MKTYIYMYDKCDHENLFDCYKYSRYPPRVLSPFRGGWIAHLSDPDSYAGWSFYTLVRATQVRQVEG